MLDASRLTPNHLIAEPKTRVKGLDVLLMGRLNAVGGSGRVVQLLHHELLEMGCSVHAGFPGSIKMTFEPWYTQNGARATFIPGFPRAAERSRLASAKALARFLKAQPFKVGCLHYSGSTFSFLDALPFWLAKKPFVLSAHHPTPVSECSRVSRVNTRLAARLASAVTATSRYHREILLGLGVPEQKIHVVPNGIDLDGLLAGKPKGEFRVPGRLMVGTVCRQEKDKRIQEMAQALAASPTFREKGFWLVAGRGSLEEENRRFAEALLPGQVRFLGPVPDVAPVFASLDLFALVSDLEGFGLVYGEAAAFGVPSVATDQGGTVEFIGECGLLARPGDIRGVAHAVERLLADQGQRVTMGEAMRLRVKAEYTAATMTLRYLEVMESLWKRPVARG